MIDDIRYLIVFAKIAEVGSMSGAAEALGITTATISQHLTKLEKNLDTALLYRNTRKQALTPDGENLLETARAMLDLYEKGIIGFKQRSTLMTSSLRISIPAMFINSSFMDEVARFIGENPDIQLSIVCSDNRQDIIGENIDVAFRIGDMPDSSLKSKPIFSFPRRVVASPEFLARHGPIRHPRDLAAVPWIGLTMRADNRHFRHPSGEECGIRYTPCTRVDNVAAAYQLALRGVGLAAPPEFMVERDVADGALEWVLPEWSQEPMRVYAVWPSNVSSSSVAYRLIHVICNALQHVRAMAA
ncbi:transcriptional regulator [Chromobacterium sp. ATCC 53434]|uniref:LysR family transcriptional regulator n=1 Tax=Chromobacterium sp. (strain ATCC 53434 / SC 14030) TaxID=2059672 RepID=UPI000C7562FA|nr:LysR family transcriptional regulator [Chromobacterium sp. ATCC 53434]AUH49393.1 transcriptional regulator [Chromobacterium sp. ATCC 53434]